MMNPAVNLQVNPTPPSHQLKHQIGTVLIIAYKESTELLEATLTQEGLSCKVLRQVHQEEFKGFSPSYLCMLNHRRAWETAAQAEKPTLILEADFVPVVGFGQLPLPFDPNRTDTGIAWLYTCAPQIYSVSKEGYTQGFSTAMVAYLVTPQSAPCLIQLAEQIRENPGPTSYSAWDSMVDKVLRERNFKNYLGFRNYGEHGGKPNPEHRQQGLSPVHRADVLYGELAFLPIYAAVATNPQAELFQARLQARLKGLFRLATGKFLRFKIVRNSSVPLRLIRVAVVRQLSRHL